VRDLFAGMRGRSFLLEAAAPHDAVRLIEEELRIPRESWRR